jgi:ketosteroid isomerase-like protein
VHPNEALVTAAWDAINRRDYDAFSQALADDFVWHGAGTRLEGSDAITGMMRQMVAATANTLRVDVHDILANDEHAVVIQTTRAERQGRQLEDRVVYVLHVTGGRIREAFFVGDPRVQDDFFGGD